MELLTTTLLTKHQIRRTQYRIPALELVDSTYLEQGDETDFYDQERCGLHDMSSPMMSCA